LPHETGQAACGGEPSAERLGSRQEGCTKADTTWSLSQGGSEKYPRAIRSTVPEECRSSRSDLDSRRGSRSTTAPGEGWTALRTQTSATACRPADPGTRLVWCADWPPARSSHPAHL